MDDPDYLRSWSCSLNVKGNIGQRSEEPSSYVTEYEAAIIGDTDRTVEVGALRYFIVDLLAAEDIGNDPFEVMDSYSADLAEFCRLVNSRGFVPKVAGLIGTRPRPVLIIDKIEIAPEYRGHGLGLMALSIACDVAGIGCALAALIAFRPNGMGSRTRSRKRLPKTGQGYPNTTRRRTFSR